MAFIFSKKSVPSIALLAIPSNTTHSNTTVFDIFKDAHPRTLSWFPATDSRGGLTWRMGFLAREAHISRKASLRKRDLAAPESTNARKELF